jgi:hypothetical protein
MELEYVLFLSSGEEGEKTVPGWVLWKERI